MSSATGVLLLSLLGCVAALESGSSPRCDLRTLPLADFQRAEPPTEPVLLTGWAGARAWLGGDGGVDAFLRQFGDFPQFVKGLDVRPLLDEAGHRRVESTADVLRRCRNESVLLFAVDAENGPFFKALDAAHPQGFGPPKLARVFNGPHFRIVSGAARGSAHVSHTHGASWLAQLEGRKAWWFAPPGDRPSTKQADLAECAALARGRARAAGGPTYCEQQPGQLVWFPEQWWHATCALDAWSLAIGAQAGEPSVPGLSVERALATLAWRQRGPGAVSSPVLHRFGTLAQYYDDLTRDEAGRRDPSKTSTLAVHRVLGPPGNRSADTHFALVRAALVDAPAVRAAPDGRAVLLDAGCGIGAGLVYLEARQPRWELHGVTLSPAQLHYIETGLRPHRFSARLGSYDELDALPRLDGIYCVEALVHSPDLSATLASWARKLAPGGAVVVIDDFLAERAAAAASGAAIGAYRELWMANTVVTVAQLAARAELVGLRIASDRDIGAEYDVLRWNYNATRVRPGPLRQWGERARKPSKGKAGRGEGPLRPVAKSVRTSSKGGAWRRDGGGAGRPSRRLDQAGRARLHQGFAGGNVRRQLYVNGTLEYHLVTLVKLISPDSPEATANGGSGGGAPRRIWDIASQLRSGDGASAQQCLSGWYCCGQGPEWAHRMQHEHTGRPEPYVVMDPSLFSDGYVQAFTRHLSAYYNAPDGPISGRFLDIGATGSTASGMKAATSKFARFAGPLQYWVLDADVAVEGLPNSVRCDITRCDAAPTAGFDVTFSHFVLEHVREPWKAFDTIARVTKRGGLALHAVPWSYHWHATPADYYRFSHQALESLFVDRGFDVLEVKYDLCSKREHALWRIDEHFDKIWLLYVVAKKR